MQPWVEPCGPWASPVHRTRAVWLLNSEKENIIAFPTQLARTHPIKSLAPGVASAQILDSLYSSSELVSHLAKMLSAASPEPSLRSGHTWVMGLVIPYPPPPGQQHLLPLGCSVLHGSGVWSPPWLLRCLAHASGLLEKTLSAQTPRDPEGAVTPH